MLRINLDVQLRLKPGDKLTVGKIEIKKDSTKRLMRKLSQQKSNFESLKLKEWPVENEWQKMALRESAERKQY